MISSFSTEHRRHRGTSVKLTAAAMTSGSSSGKVLLARALESTSSWIIKHILFSQCSSLTVRIDAKSNKSLIMGNFDNVSISARHCRFRFNLLQFTRFDIVATRLHLGFVPLLIPFLPMLIWKFRRYIWASIMCGTFLQFIAGNSRQTGKFSKRVLDAFESGKRKVWHMMRMKPSTIAYSIAVSNQDVNGSILAELWLRQILRSLVQNSLIGAAAALGGAQDAIQSRIEDEYRERGLKRWRRTGNTRLLPFSGGANSDGGALTSTQSNQQGLVNSALLSATSFDLKETYFADGRLVLSAEAILNEENGRKKVLPFTIRTKLEPTKVDYVNGSNCGRLNPRLDRRKDYNALGFVIPECRLNTSPLTAGTLLGRFVPDIVWITFGLGVVVPFGMHSQIYRADVEIDKAVPGAEVCKLDGSISMFAVHNETANVVSIVRSK